MNIIKYNISIHVFVLYIHIHVIRLRKLKHVVRWVLEHVSIVDGDEGFGTYTICTGDGS